MLLSVTLKKLIGKTIFILTYLEKGQSKIVFSSTKKYNIVYLRHNVDFPEHVSCPDNITDSIALGHQCVIVHSTLKTYEVICFKFKHFLVTSCLNF